MRSTAESTPHPSGSGLHHCRSVLVQITVLGVILIAGSGFRLDGLADRSFWFDEAYAWRTAQYSPGEIWDRLRSDNSPPLYWTALRYWMGAFGESPVALRSLSVVSGLAAIVGVWLFVRELLSGPLARTANVSRQEMVWGPLLVPCHPPADGWYPRGVVSGKTNRQEGVMEKRYRVTVLASERDELRTLVRVGQSAAQKLVRARILLLADHAEGGSAQSDPEIVESLGCGRARVERVRKRFDEGGLDAALTPEPSLRVSERKWDGKAEAHLIALACGAPPEGRSRWTLRLLGDRMVVPEHVESVSDETVRRVLKKTNSSLG